MRKLIKWLSCMMVTTALCVTGSILGVETYGDMDGNFEYAYDETNGTLSINGYNGSDYDIEIPDEIGGHKVTSLYIGYDFNNVKSLTIPAGVKSITFESVQRNLTNITVDENNESYKSVDGVLYSSDMKELIVYPNKGDEVVIPEGVETIDENAICNQNIQTLTIPSTLQWIYVDYDDVIKKCEIKDGIYRILELCYRLENIKVSEDNPICCSVDGILYSKDKTMLIKCPILKDGIVDVPPETKIIYFKAFAECIKIDEINMGDNVENIWTSAFFGCASLKKLHISESCTSIGVDAFRECVNLTEINIPAGVKYLNRDMFELTGITEIDFPEDSEFRCDNGIVYSKDMKKVEFALGVFGDSVQIPEGVVEICDEAFYNFDAVKEVILPESLEKIGYQAFCYMEDMKSIVIPENVKYIESAAFFRSGLEKVVIESTKLENIGDDAFLPDGHGNITVIVRNKQMYDMVTEKFGYYDIPATVIIEEKQPELKLNKTKVVLYTGNQKNTTTVKATLNNITGKVKWKTSDKTVATVDNGKITAVGKGSAVVSASIGKNIIKVKVTVKNPVVKLVKGSSTVKSINVKKGKSVSYKVKVTPVKSKVSIVQDAKSKKMAKVTYKNNLLSVKGLKKGSTVIKIKCGAGVKKIQVTVK